MTGVRVGGGGDAERGVGVPEVVEAQPLRQARSQHGGLECTSVEEAVTQGTASRSGEHQVVGIQAPEREVLAELVPQERWEGHMPSGVVLGRAELQMPSEVSERLGDLDRAPQQVESTETTRTYLPARRPV